MKSKSFWSVELGTGMGPLVLGADFEQLSKALAEHNVERDRLTLDGLGKVSVPAIGTQFVFSRERPLTLVRIDVSDERLRFGSLDVIGKRAHEIVGLFKVPRKETLWCNVDPEEAKSTYPELKSSVGHGRELLSSGTIWLTRLGLGLTLRDGLVATVHLCDPAHSPQHGSGPWTKEQQRLSEVRELPTISTTPRNQNRKPTLIGLIHLLLFGSLGILIWWAFQVQQKWDSAIEVSAVVVAVDPPAPNPLPNDITVRFQDATGKERQETLGYLQFLTTPKMGDEVQVRYLSESPDEVLGPVAARDAGYATAFPIGMGILAVYFILLLIVSGTVRHRLRSR
jgi:hypothetical protein